MKNLEIQTQHEALFHMLSLLDSANEELQRTIATCGRSLSGRDLSIFQASNLPA